MGWRDAPVVEDSRPAGGWASAPVVEDVQPMRKTRGVLGGLAEGATDTLLGLGQIGIRAREALGIPSSVSSEQAQQHLQAREQRIAASRGPDAGIDWARMGGQALSTAPMAVLPVGPLVGGALAGMTQPVVEGDFLAGKAKQGAIGAGAGAIAHGIGAAVRGIAGTAGKDVTALAREGVRPTPGQVIGGVAGDIEERVASLPFAGAPIRKAQEKATQQLNVAAYNRALRPIGQKITPGKLGGDAVAEVESKLSGAYDTLLPKLTFTADKQFSSAITDIGTRAAADLPEAEAKRAIDIINRTVGKHNSLSGKALKEAESRLRYWAEKYGASSNPEHQALGEYLAEAGKAFRGALERSNPSLAPQLRKINEGWANFVRVRDAASRIGTDDSVFTAAQLQSAVRAQDKSVGKGAFAKERALMQDLSQPAKNVMGRKLPTSGTAERTALSLGDPRFYMGIAGAPVTAALYSDPSRRILSALLAQRPPVMQQLGIGIQKLAPAAGGPAPRLTEQVARR